MARHARRVGNLPAEVTSFVGRRRELADVRRKLAQARLVTLTGPGGVGKTRLAIRTAVGLARGFRDGGWLVELADVLDPALVSSAVMMALDLRDQAAAEPLALLRSYLRDKELLLVVDNCEHLLDGAAAAVTGILAEAPGVRVLATSREPLSVPGEHVVPVPPLEPPRPGEPLSQNEAVSMFADRAAAASGSFELTAANQAAVAELCRRLDGLPLAIELAAVRTRVLTAEQIRDRLADRFGLLAGGRVGVSRHQTLRTTIEWSHDLLSGTERAVLRRLCVFAGRFMLEDVESVCGGSLDVLASLVAKSLVVKADTARVACYGLHETMREFARLQLAEAGEEEDTWQRCTEYYWSRCRQSAADSRYRLAEWLAWVDLEIDNVRAVLARCDAARGTVLVTSLAWFWITRATSEGIRRLDGLLTGEVGDTDLCALAWFLRGFLAVLKADPAGARPALQAAMAACRQAGLPGLLAEALSLASITENMTGDRAAAGQLLAQAEVTAADLDYYRGTISVLQARALNGFFAGDPAAVRAAAADGARLAGEAGDLYGQEMMLLNLGCGALIAGDLAESGPRLAEALRIARQIDDRVGQSCLLDAFGCHAARRGQARLAARLLGAADAVRDQAGANPMPFLAPAFAQAAGSATAALGQAGYEAEYAAGRRMGRDAALGLALGEPSHAATPVPGGASSASADAGLLSKRETDVARLVADGLTNRQIGTRLFISERTVDSHVRNILNKLGITSRAQIAAWLASSDNT
jgi:predicted ATPase/DNA-binding CsgD family transcriptional regulator